MIIVRFNVTVSRYYCNIAQPYLGVDISIPILQTKAISRNQERKGKNWKEEWVMVGKTWRLGSGDQVITEISQLYCIYVLPQGHSYLSMGQLVT